MYYYYHYNDLILLLFFFFFTLTCLWSSALAQRQVIPNTYLLEYGDRPDINKHHAQIMSLLAPIAPHMKVRQIYRNPSIFSGMSVQFHSDSHFHSLSSLLALPPSSLPPLSKREYQNRWVKTIYPLYQFSQPDAVIISALNTSNSAKSPERPMDSNISQLDQVHHQLKITGKDVFVCLLDSGVDYHHPALGGGIGPSYKIKMGANLVNPDEDDKSIGHHYDQDDPMDPCPANGHGTHVAGIIGGMDQHNRFVGVAPDATLGMWRIFGCEGGTSEDTVIQALTMAQQAGCQVINLSLGVQNAWPEDAMAVVAERLSQQGVIVVTVAGNQGDAGVFLQNTPGTGKHVISVASLDNTFYPTRVLRIDAFPDELFEYEFSTSTKSFPEGTIVTFYNSTGHVTDACPDTNSKNTASSLVNGNILLVQRGSCTFHEKADVARSLGAIGLFVYDPITAKNKTDKDLFSMQTMNDTLPVAAIPLYLAHRLLSSHHLPASVSFPSGLMDKNVETALQVSDFSSTGPSYELDLKPNIAGIGGQVFSTLPLHLENNEGYEKGWGIRSGTSMAAPHVTGVIALILQAYRQKLMSVNSDLPTPTQYLIEHLQNHAMVPMVVDSEEDDDADKDEKKQEIATRKPSHPLLQGAGLVQPFETIMNPIHVSPSQISFNDTSSITEYKSQMLQITNYGSMNVTLTLRHIPSDSLDPFDIDSIKKNSRHHHHRQKQQHVDNSTEDVNHYTPLEPVDRGDTTVSLNISQYEFHLTPGQTTSVQIQVQLPDSITYDYQMYGGYLQWVSSDASNKIHASVPYFGVLGALRDLPLFDDGFPYLSRSENLSIVYTPTDVFTFYLPPSDEDDNGNDSTNNDDDKDDLDDELKLGTMGDNGITVSQATTNLPKGQPTVVIRLLTATRIVHAEVIQQTSGHQDKIVGYIPGFPTVYLERNRRKPENYFRQFTWDGNIQSSPVINTDKHMIQAGDYAIRVRALHLLGHPENPNDWEVWVSGPIHVTLPTP